MKNKSVKPQSIPIKLNIYLGIEKLPDTQHDLTREGLNIDFLKPLVSVETPNYLGSMWINNSHKKLPFKQYLN